VVRLGLHLLRSSSWTAVPTDKDGGMALVNKNLLTEAKLRLMESQCYRERPFPENPFTDVFTDFIGYVKRAVDILRQSPDYSEDEAMKLLQEVMIDRRTLDPRGLVCSLQVTVKTHKDPGEVSMRAIHSTSTSPITVGMRWIRHRLRPVLRSVPCILRDSQHLLTQLKGITVPSRAKLFKFDVKEFFMSGEHRSLVSEVSSLIVSDRRAFREVLEGILSCQYLMVPGVPGRWWQVQVGSGMGLMISGEISDLAFYSMVESKFVLKAETKSKFDLIYYGRFKDDGLVILGGSPDSRREFFTEMKRFSRFFKIIVESVSDVSAVMLDVELFKGPQWSATGQLDSILYTKPTSQWIPLSVRSGHPESVHRSWPKGQLARFSRLCTRRADAELLKQRFIQELIAAGGRPPDLNRSPPTRSSRTPSSYLVIPYRKEWATACIMAAIRRVRDRHLADLQQEGTGDYAEVGLSWSLGGLHLVHFLRGL
jgi:hypothetical protein